MNIETEVKAAEQEVKTVVEAVAAEANKVEGVVAAEVKTAEEKIKEAFVKLTAEEKLFLREAELEFLKVQMEVQRLQKIGEEKSKSYIDFVEKLYVKYGLTKAEYVFDGAIALFKKL